MQDEDGDSDDDASAASTRESTSDEPWLSSDWCVTNFVALKML